MYSLSLWMLVICLLTVVRCAEQNPYIDALNQRPWKSVQDYIEVRPGAFLFYWLYFADGRSVEADRKPLIIWIQGGPGLAASGIGNFAEIGPLDMNMQPRNHTWVKGRNVLLIDHPVGTGFSYVKDKSLLVNTDREMAVDLSRAIRVFFRRHKRFRRTPTYIIGQSYGGKLCPRLAFYLQTAIDKKRLKMNFKGIGMGSAWANPKESSLMQPEFLYTMGLIDRSTYLEASALIKHVCSFADKKKFQSASELYTFLYQSISLEAGSDFNFYNIHQKSSQLQMEALSYKMNKYVKPALSDIVDQGVDWKWVSEDVYLKLNESFFVPSTKFLEMILNTTKLKVVVYNGNLDSVTPLAGASNWVHKLNWYGAEEFKRARRNKIKGNNNGYYKQSHQFSFWWVFDSGHWVPEDNPVAMEHILQHILED